MEYPDFYWLNSDSRKFLWAGYIPKEQTGEGRVRAMGDRAEQILGIPGFSDKFFNYMARGYYSIASPIWSNFGMPIGLPISCNSSYISDDTTSILLKAAEVGYMTKGGAGTSAFFGDLRPRGAHVTGGYKSEGPVPFLSIYQSVAHVISQGNVRRGAFAAYLPVEHPDIREFLKCRSDGHEIQHISLGVTNGDAWMKDLLAGNKENLYIWGEIIKMRFKTGYPYVIFSDTANKAAPQVYKDKGKRIHASNLCTEIFLSSSEDESFVCDLSSVNLLHFHEIKNTDAVKTLTYFLDAVMTEYIEKTKDIALMRAAHNFAKRQRALGVGVLGWHSCLQRYMIPFESMEAKFLNVEIHKHIKEETEAATRELATLFGEPELLVGTGLRNVTTRAIAPTTSSSVILGQVSQSIEPLESNYFVNSTAKGNFSYKNPKLAEVLREKGFDDEETWHSILVRGGSVQHLDCLTEHEKAVFKTFSETSQKEIVIQASQRQKYIDQGQSLNLKIPSDTPKKEVSKLMIFAYEQGIKSLYYQKGTNPAQQVTRNLLSCASCEG